MIPTVFIFILLSGCVLFILAELLKWMNNLPKQLVDFSYSKPLLSLWRTVLSLVYMYLGNVRVDMGKTCCTPREGLGVYLNALKRST